ncbi:hypothetical protein DRQ36_04955 [bacterium]|nr:MAG: hypothetical protein DRQ36_04955 [bacterium]
MGQRKHRRGTGIKDLLFHDLIHKFVLHLFIKGINSKTVRRLLGHKDIRMTMRYPHLSKEHVREAVETLNNEYGTNL